jgi:hypothetical protein
VWIALNPSTADEQTLDPTLKRIKDFSSRWGYNGFHMLNLFAFRATDPKVMKKADDPIGPENDKYLLQFCSESARVIACWGDHGTHMARASKVQKILRGLDVYYLKFTAKGNPGHPLYIHGDTNLVKL